jgi:type II secretory pathway component GspD/PulD (secretin)
MNVIRIFLLTLFCAGSCISAALAQSTPAPVPDELPDIPAETDVAEEPDVSPAEIEPGEPVDLPEPVPALEPDRVVEPSPAPVTDQRSRARSERPRSDNLPNDLPAPPAEPIGENERILRLNFRGVPLDMVLNYLSDAAGFIINLETEVRGRVDAWSNKPLTKEEAIDLLNSVLNKNGYAAIRNGRILTIVSRDEAKRRNIPVVSGNRPEDIPVNDEVVTQIIPVRFISAVQLVKDLQPLLPEKAELSANEGGNALVLTDTQSNIRRMVEIVEALDQAISSVSSVRVFPLEYADAKTLATIITQLFQPQETSRNDRNDPRRVFAAFAGRGGQGGDQGQTAAASATGGRAPVPRVMAVADERSNSVVVSAPSEQMAIVEGIVQEVDTNVEDITELRVFHLNHADPQETADLLTSLFETSSNNNRSNNQRQRFRFGGQGGRGNNNAAQSERLLKESQVVAVPDLRTGSVVVSASRNLMTQIEKMLMQLDADPARQQKVFVYSVENTDPQAVQEVLQSLFPEQSLNQNANMRNNRTDDESLLSNRQTQTRNQGARGNTRTGTGTTFGNAPRGNQ